MTVGRQIEEPVVDQHMILFDRVLEFIAARVFRDTHVQFEMKCMNRILQLRIAAALPKTVVERIQLLGQARQLHPLLHGRIYRAESRRLGLKGFANNATAANLLGLRNADSGSRAGAAFEQLLALQLPESLRNRKQAHPELFGETPGRQRFAGAKLAAQNSLAYPIVGSIPQRCGEPGRALMRLAAHHQVIQTGFYCDVNMSKKCRDPLRFRVLSKFANFNRGAKTRITTQKTITDAIIFVIKNLEAKRRGISAPLDFSENISLLFRRLTCHLRGQLENRSGPRASLASKRRQKIAEPPSRSRPRLAGCLDKVPLQSAFVQGIEFKGAGI
jgi:hypothetical protein